MTSDGQVRPGHRRIAPALAALTVCTLSALVASSRIMVTSGGIDQRHYHWVTVQYFRDTFPRIDIVNVDTATAPLYHLVLAAVSGPFDLTEHQTQFVASLFAADLAALAVWFAMSTVSTLFGVLAVAPLLLSPYFWQSGLWMLNDAAALFFGLAALILVVRRDPGNVLSQFGVGLLLAAAVATRQTYVWAVVPCVAVTGSSMNGSATAAKMGAICRVAAPAFFVLAVLATAWHGLTPPGFREMNAANRSPVSLSYCFAVAAMFFVPIVIGVVGRPVRRTLAPLVLGTLAAVPAIVFPSVATVPPDNTRYGGLIWMLVAHGPSYGDRSIVLAILAFIGAWSVCHVLMTLDQPTKTLAGTALVALAVCLSAGGQLYQKYFELPVAAIAMMTIVALAQGGLIKRNWPLIALILLQATLTMGIVLVPLVAAR
ncbi:MAG: hypothetical protein WBB07_08365 [Mycobacterium sp.]